jgi:hypothetical protein
VLRTIVEGEPGIFPAPVARVMQSIGGLFRRKEKKGDGATTSDPPPDSPGDAGARPEDRPGRSGESR